MLTLTQHSGCTILKFAQCTPLTKSRHSAALHLVPAKRRGHQEGTPAARMHDECHISASRDGIRLNPCGHNRHDRERQNDCSHAASAAHQPHARHSDHAHAPTKTLLCASLAAFTWLFLKTAASAAHARLLRAQHQPHSWEPSQLPVEPTQTRTTAPGSPTRRRTAGLIDSSSRSRMATPPWQQVSNRR